MKYNVNFTEIVAQLVKVFSNESMNKAYNATGVMSEGVCGWCGVMSPLSRPAYVQAFGAEVVALAESEARKEIKAAQDRHNATEYHAHTLEADNLQGVPAVGGFFWAHNSGMKCDDGRGVFGEINALLWRSEYDESEHDRREFNKQGARLCKVSQVFTVSAEDFDRPSLADELTAEHKPEGGSMSDDIEDGADWYSLTDEQRATLYTFGALVTDGRRYYLIDSEGYDYPRYIYVPKSWREDLADITTAERERIEAENRRKAQEEADAKAARRAEYVARCEKWAHLMQDVRPLEEAERKAWEAYTRNGYRKNSLEDKAQKAAKRKTMNTQKANILAMCRAAFPGVKFSVSVRHGWGADWDLTWQDGPTEEEFAERCDLDLFCSSWDTFDGMDDSTGTDYAEFTDFSALTMGSNGGNIKTERTMSEEAKGAIFAEVLAVAPEYDDRNSYGYYNEIDVTPEKAQQVGEAVGVAASAIYYDWHGMDYRLSLSQLARRVWNYRSYTTAETSPEPTDPTEGGKAQKVEAVAGGNAPEGLELIETAEGVAVVGDSRTTYRHRKEIKAHGATWNKAAQRWEAVDAEGVESLRQWFGIVDDVELIDVSKIAEAVAGTNEQAAEAVAHIEAVAEAVAQETTATAEDAPRYEVGEKLSLCRCCGGYYLKGDRETWQGVAERFNMTWGGAVGAWFVRDEIAADVLEFVAVNAETIGEGWTECEINAEKLAEVHTVEACEGCAVTFSQSGAVVTFDEQEAQKVGDLLSEGESNAHPIRKGDRIKWRTFSRSGKELDGTRYEVAGIHHNPHRDALVIELWEIDGNGKADAFRRVYHDLRTFATSWMCNDWTPSPDPTEPTAPTHEGGEAQEVAESADTLQSAEEISETATTPDPRNVGKVWQYGDRNSVEPDTRHEIRQGREWFTLTVGKYKGDPVGQMFPDHFATFQEAQNALKRFRPGCYPIYGEAKRKTA